MNIASPESIIFWATLVFIILLVLLRKYAWKPILGAVHKREHSINEALESAVQARMDMDNLMAENEKLMKKAREERDAMLKEAHGIKEKIITEASEAADKKANAMIQRAKEAIEAEKHAAMAELKSQMADLSIEIAEKVVRKELHSKDEQMQLVDGMLDKVTLN